MKIKLTSKGRVARPSPSDRASIYSFAAGIIESKERDYMCNAISLVCINWFGRYVDEDDLMRCFPEFKSFMPQSVTQLPRELRYTAGWFSVALRDKRIDILKTCARIASSKIKTK